MQPLPNRPKTGSLDDLGLMAYMDENYPQYGGGKELVKRLKAGQGNAEIGRAFGPEGRPKSGQAVARWREKWEEEEAVDD